MSYQRNSQAVRTAWMRMQANSWPMRAPHRPWTEHMETPFVHLVSNPDWIGCITGAQGGQDVRNCPQEMRIFFLEWYYHGEESPRPEMPRQGQYWSKLQEYE